MRFFNLNGEFGFLFFRFEYFLSIRYVGYAKVIRLFLVWWKRRVLFGRNLLVYFSVLGVVLIGMGVYLDWAGRVVCGEGIWEGGRGNVEGEG